jgi:hypothetical protein
MENKPRQIKVENKLKYGEPGLSVIVLYFPKKTVSIYFCSHYRLTENMARLIYGEYVGAFSLMSTTPIDPVVSIEMKTVSVGKLDKIDLKCTVTKDLECKFHSEVSE